MIKLDCNVSSLTQKFPLYLSKSKRKNLKILSYLYLISKVGYLISKLGWKKHQNKYMHFKQNHLTNKALRIKANHFKNQTRVDLILKT